MKKYSKAWLARILAVALAMIVGMTACGSTADNPDTDTQTPATQLPESRTPASEDPSQTPSEPPSEPAGNDCPFELFVYDLPSGYKKPIEQGGAVTEEHYTTYAYDNNGVPGEEIEGTLYVYTPYNYDSSKEYNVLYLMHGAGETVGFWFGVGEYAEGGERYNKAQANTAVKIIDNMIANGDCGDIIAVAVTFANNDSSDLRGFGYELRNDILPAVESKYSTYAGGDTSIEGLIASRDHRAFTGFSKGSMTALFSVWEGNFEYFAYIGNLSGMELGESSAVGPLVEMMSEGGKYADYEMKYWYNGNGTEDTAEAGHLAWYAAMLEQGGDMWQEGEDYVNGDNCIMVDKPGKRHNYANWNVDLYNILNVFFKVP